ncbi:Acetyl esterase [Planctomycetes bacterium CA13]|uniref:Acetyl esterase n=1 Tax=Novipirellula herctigrandis TaxID=2527986 RepID=A0A5C5Z1E3_9BACT|nr:Acetyl esterase [Planctomycetes bacterium CA13]
MLFPQKLDREQFACLGRALLLAFAVWAGAVNPASASAESVTPLPCFPNQRYNDVEGKAGLCDVLLPTVDPSPSGYPTVLVIHGGAWMSGSKWTIERYSRYLAREGYATVTINYRLAPSHTFPKQVDDVRQSLVWISEHADKFHFDLERIGLFGYSAGGHLSLLVSALQDEPIETQRTASQWHSDDARWSKLPKIRATCAGGPPCNFQTLPLDNTSLAFFLGSSRRKKPATYQAASPIAHVSAGDPPVQIIHGESDALVPIKTSVAFLEAMQSTGATCELAKLPGQGHMLTFLHPKTSELMREFFAVKLRPEK